MVKNKKGFSWDGKSRVVTNLYRKNFDEIFKKESDEPDPNWIEGYNKWKKEQDELKESYEQSKANKKERDDKR